MSDIRRFFISRFGAEGRLIELDFSQLEVRVLAFLSKDKQLRMDLENGVDVHSLNAERLFGRNFTPKQRKTAKSLSFELQYGSGAASMAAKNGISLAKAKEFISLYYKRYPSVEKYHQMNIEAVEKSGQNCGRFSERGFPIREGFLSSLTGRKYVFYEGEAPDWLVAKTGRNTSFSPTKIKNYPVQGLATADIVPMVLGKVYREIKKRREWDERVLLINTTHDSITLDVDGTHLVVGEVAKFIKEVMEKAPTMMKERFGVDFDLPLPVDVQTGTNWLEMGEINL